MLRTTRVKATGKSCTRGGRTTRMQRMAIVHAIAMSALAAVTGGCARPEQAPIAGGGGAGVASAHGDARHSNASSESERAIAAARQLVAVMELEIAAIAAREFTMRSEVARLEGAADAVADRTARLQDAIESRHPSSAATVRRFTEFVSSGGGMTDESLALSRRTRELQHATIALRAKWQAFQSRRAAEVRGEVATLPSDPPSDPPSALAER